MAPCRFNPAIAQTQGRASHARPVQDFKDAASCVAVWHLPGVDTFYEFQLIIRRIIMEFEMISGHVFIATSVDGFIARNDGTIEWLLERDDPSENHGYDDFIEEMDAIIMGRGTFEAVRDISPWLYPRPVLVLSATLADQPVPDGLEDKVRICKKSPREAMAMLETEGCRRVYVDGGLTIQSFLQQGLIEDMVITRVPIVLGSGRSLFGQTASDICLIHKETRSFPSGLVQSSYRVARDCT